MSSLPKSTVHDFKSSDNDEDEGDNDDTQEMLEDSHRSGGRDAEQEGASDKDEDFLKKLEN